jgi:thiol-disulfide isomerase/thioredoxin
MKLLFRLTLLACLAAYPASAQVPTPQTEPKQPQVTLLHFWATWCGPCVVELPSIDRLAKDLADKHVVVFAMSEDQGGPEVVKEFLATHPGMEHLKILFDPSNAMGKQQKVDSIPTTIVIGTNGKEITRFVGSQDWDSPEQRAALAKDMAGK